MTEKCPWALSSPIEELYHDREWGVPLHDDRLLFEFLLLEGAQAGLSWRTILNKRETYREAFANFDAAVVAGYGEMQVQQLLLNPGIIRNRLKVQAFVDNAKAFLRVQDESNGFDRYIWQFVDGRTIHNHWRTMAEVPAFTAEAERMSRGLKQKGFKFVGPTICYAYMQAVGMVNDHLTHCFRYRDLAQ